MRLAVFERHIPARQKGISWAFRVNSKSRVCAGGFCSGCFKGAVEVGRALTQRFQINCLLSCPVSPLQLLLYIGIISRVGAAGSDKWVFDVGACQRRNVQWPSSTLLAFLLILHWSFQELSQMWARLTFCNIYWRLWDFMVMKETLLRQFTSTHGLQKAVLYLIIISCLLAWHLSKGGSSNDIVVNVLAFIYFGLLTPVNLLVILLIGSMIDFAKMILFVNFLHDVIFA